MTGHKPILFPDNIFGLKKSNLIFFLETIREIFFESVETWTFVNNFDLFISSKQ